MLTKVLFAAAAAGLVSTAAFAQVANNNPATQQPDTSASSPHTVNPPLQGEGAVAAPVAPATTGQASDVVAISADQARAQGIPVQVIASAPVPDTPENRRAYGQPLSMTGKRTAPVGN